MSLLSPTAYMPRVYTRASEPRRVTITIGHYRPVLCDVLVAASFCLSVAPGSLGPSPQPNLKSGLADVRSTYSYHHIYTNDEIIAAALPAVLDFTSLTTR